MDEKDLSEKVMETYLNNLNNSNKFQIESGNLSKPSESTFDTIQKQRHFQRKVMFYSALSLTTLSTFILWGIILCQILLRIFGKTPTISLLDGYELEIFSIGVIAQYISVIIVITKSLWDDNPYKDLLKNNSKSN
jgi:hypothetical protein